MHVSPLTLNKLYMRRCVQRPGFCELPVMMGGWWLRGCFLDFKYASSAYAPVCPKPNGQSLVAQASGWNVESCSWAMLMRLRVV